MFPTLFMAKQSDIFYQKMKRLITSRLQAKVLRKNSPGNVFLLTGVAEVAEGYAGILKPRCSYAVNQSQRLSHQPLHKPFCLYNPKLKISQIARKGSDILREKAFCRIDKWKKKLTFSFEERRKLYLYLRLRPSNRSTWASTLWKSTFRWTLYWGERD